MRANTLLWVVGVAYLCVLVAVGAVGQAAPGKVDSSCLPNTSAAAEPAPSLKAEPDSPAQPVVHTPMQQAYDRLTVGQKFRVFVKQTYSPYTLLDTAFNAGISQATGGWYMYGGGLAGYGKRYGATLANSESSVFFGWFLYPTIFHQDPRYFAAPHKGLAYRAGYAVSRVLVTKNDLGQPTFNTSHVLGVATSAGFANMYYPRNLRNAGDSTTRFGNTMLSDATTNLVREFWPDIWRKMWKHQPRKLKELEQSPRVEKIEQAVGLPMKPPCPAQEKPSQEHKLDITTTTTEEAPPTK